jgi:predicted nuclease of predicted toxin-antitoxin system
MRLLFDQNISHRILPHLNEVFSGSTTVKGEGMINAPDLELWEFAKRQNLIIVTQDSDFNDLTSLHGFPPKVIWIRVGNLKTHQIADMLTENISESKSF